MIQKRSLSAVVSAVALFVAVGSLASCIQDEPLNAECDITGLEAAWVEANRGILVGEPRVANDRVTLTIAKGTPRNAMAPKFTLTEGARLTMKAEDGSEVEANGVTRNFSSPQTYTAHSQDGAWKKDYTVAVNYPLPITLCSFEHFKVKTMADKDGKVRELYYEWFQPDHTDPSMPLRPDWASGNGGYQLTGMAKTPDQYPTTVSPLGYKGNCVRLETRATGSFGDQFKMPIAAGNLFVGEFRSTQAAMFPMKATRFGLQLVGGRPKRLEGYYKYTPGELVTDNKKNPRPDLRDSCDIYAVLYEVDPAKFVSLQGDDVLSSPRIVSLARLDKPAEPTEWTYFTEDFKPMNGKEFSDERLNGNGYAIAIVATSSRQGAYFTGAIGSVLYIDELKVVWEGEE